VTSQQLAEDQLGAQRAVRPPAGMSQLAHQLRVARVGIFVCVFCAHAAVLWFGACRWPTTHSAGPNLVLLTPRQTQTGVPTQDALATSSRTNCQSSSVGDLEGSTVTFYDDVPSIGLTRKELNEPY
jgi:hypothetical protein